MAGETLNVAVGTEPVRLSGAQRDSDARQSVTVLNESGTVTVWVGFSDDIAAGVDTFPLRPGAAHEWTLGYGEHLFGVVASGSQGVYVARTGL